jgi:hypothetical protein
MGHLSNMRSVIDRNVVMQRTPVQQAEVLVISIPAEQVANN